MIVCGLDIGSTNLKVVLADGSGRTLWVKSVPTPHVNDGLGTTTDATVLMELLEDLVIEGWRMVGAGQPLAAISSAGVGEDGVCADVQMRASGSVSVSRASTFIRRRASGCGCASTARLKSARRSTGSRLPTIRQHCGAARPS
jgi:sugar (pentulose or hexulose) kinase